ncbi:MAG: polymer-forming cytoskeletal protein [Deltaproteobacteria bacterium]|nr:polymer-forming cytoskeletal protein [Deltaproteobacteria bacterium]
MNRSPEDRAENARADAPERSSPDQGQLHAGLAIEGNLRGRGDLRIEGVMRGSITIEGTVSIGPQAQVTAPIRARRVDVGGEVVGNIEATHVGVRSGGWVSGDVRASTIAIDDGATLEGLIDMDVEPSGRAGAGARRSR